jgi:hypothetical protein
MVSFFVGLFAQCHVYGCCGHAGWVENITSCKVRSETSTLLGLQGHQIKVARPFRANVVMGILDPGLRCASPWAIEVRRFAAKGAILERAEEVIVARALGLSAQGLKPITTRRPVNGSEVKYFSYSCQPGINARG